MEKLQDELAHAMSSYSQSNSVQMLHIRDLRREIKAKLNASTSPDCPCMQNTTLNLPPPASPM